MTKKLILKLAVSSLLIIVAVAVALHANLLKLPITKQIHVQFIPGLEDDRIMVGASHNVFIGKVIEQTGSMAIESYPSTLFAVEIVSNIKGDLSGIVTVEQEGGYQNGILYSLEGDSLITPGSTYMFSARYNESKNWYTISAHSNGRKLISADKSLTTTELLSLAQNDEKVKKLQWAYQNEILLDADVINNNTKNSYQSLHKE